MLKTLFQKKLFWTYTIIAIVFIFNISTFASNNEKSIPEIKEFWKKCIPTSGGTVFYVPDTMGSMHDEAPSYTHPYKLGNVKKGFLNDAVKLTNFVRFLSGIPSDVELKDSLNENAQYGAVLLAAVNELTHTPNKPSDMDEDFYNNGYLATSSSNIYLNVSSPADSVIGYMKDNSDNNLDSVGHRRWILNPSLKYVGFGYAKRASTMKVFDVSRKEDFEYDYIAWPNKGNFPLEFFNSNWNGNDPWSISLNPEKYSNEKIDEITVKLTRKSDNKSWSFDKNSTDKNGNYLKIENSYYGVPFCIIFRAFDLNSYKNGDEFEVSIDGIYLNNGQKTSLNYSVRFFYLNNEIRFVPGATYFYDTDYNMKDIDPGRYTSSVILNGRTLLPIRALIEELKGNVLWDGSQGKVTITLDDKKIELWINQKKSLINNVEKTSDTAPQIINGRTMVPLRFVVESLGFQVDWNPNDQIISIKY